MEPGPSSGEEASDRNCQEGKMHLVCKGVSIGT